MREDPFPVLAIPAVAVVAVSAGFFAGAPVCDAFGLSVAVAATSIWDRRFTEGSSAWWGFLHDRFHLLGRVPESWFLG